MIRKPELVLNIHLGYSIENCIKNPKHIFCLQWDILDILLVQKYTQVPTAVRPRNTGTTYLQVSTGQVPSTSSFEEINTL
jgi:hypothetical protein